MGAGLPFAVTMVGLGVIVAVLEPEVSSSPGQIVILDETNKSKKEELKRYIMILSAEDVLEIFLSHEIVFIPA